MTRVADAVAAAKSVLDAAHIAQPGCRFVFNQAAKATPDDIRRWYPDPRRAVR